jgi:SET family sugar efflux transporter-like MFS transporter
MGMTVSFISYYIVSGLGKTPIYISAYSLFGILVTVVTNKKIGAWIDRGIQAKYLVWLTIGAFVLGCVSIAATQSYIVLVTIGCFLLGLSKGNMTVMYSMGRLHADSCQLDVDQYNALLRAATSLGWMIGPALSYGLASVYPAETIYFVAALLGTLWLVIWFVAMPRDYYVASSTHQSDENREGKTDHSLLLAVTVCFCFAVANTLCASALPLFLIDEVALPTYAPGMAMSVKTFVEIIAIMGSPWLLRRIDAKGILLCTTLLAIAAFYILSQVSSLAMLGLGAVFEGAYYGLFAGTGIAFVQSLSHGRIGKAMSMYMNSLFIGGLIASPAVGLIAQMWSFKASIQTAMFGVVFASIILIGWMAADKRQQRVSDVREG